MIIKLAMNKKAWFGGSATEELRGWSVGSSSGRREGRRDIPPRPQGSGGHTERRPLPGYMTPWISNPLLVGASSPLPEPHPLSSSSAACSCWGCVQEVLPPLLWTNRLLSPSCPFFYCTFWKLCLSVNHYKYQIISYYVISFLQEAYLLTSQ